MTLALPSTQQAQMETLWAIKEDQELVCWRGSRGVPFLTPNHALALDTAASGDVLHAPKEGTKRCVVLTRVIAYQGVTLVMDAQDNHLYCLLTPVDNQL